MRSRYGIQASRGLSPKRPFGKPHTTCMPRDRPCRPPDGLRTFYKVGWEFQADQPAPPKYLFATISNICLMQRRSGTSVGPAVATADFLSGVWRSLRPYLLQV